MNKQIELSITGLINNTENFKVAKKQMEAALDLKLKIDDLNSSIRTVGDILKNDYGLEKKEFNAWLKHLYDNKIDEEIEFLEIISAAVKKVNSQEG